MQHLVFDGTLPVSFRSGTMIRRSFALFVAASLATFAAASPVAAQESRPSVEYPDDEYERYSAEQLDNLVGSIALYPDALLAQLLVAATFPDQLEEAARFVRANGTDDVDDQSWDVSVKAVAHYPSALNMMADKGDWTTALGRAYAVQSSDVMAAVQRLRAMADAQGNLQNTQQQSVSRDDGNYVIAPTQSRMIYVPTYDPYVVYTRPIFRSGFASPFWSSGVGFPIGAWLNYDLDWRARNVYYHGWDVSYQRYGGGWRQRSRPFVGITNIYVHPRYRTVYFDRDVIRRRVEYRNLDRYIGVHRDTRFSRGPVIYRGSQRSVDDYPGYDRRNDRQYDGWYDRGIRGYDWTNDRIGNRGTERTVIVNRGEGGSIGRPVDRIDRGLYDRSGDRTRDGRRSGFRDLNPDGIWGQDGIGGRRSDWSPGSRPQRETRGGGIGQPRDESRGRGNGMFGGGSPLEMMRTPQRNDAPMINPRRAEPPGVGRGNAGGRGGRERP